MTLRVLAAVLALALLGGCSSTGSREGKPVIAVTYSALGAVVRDLVGDRATVVVPMPNGQDPHDWEPSAKDIATFNRASVIVRNGLGLEAGLTKALDNARNSGVKTFVAADHIEVRHIGAEEGGGASDPDRQTGAEDPHLWMDPLAMQRVVAALAQQLKTDIGLDVSDRATDLEGRLGALDAELRQTLSVVPPERRKLVTGHESLGYFAQRYGFTLIGAIIPSGTSQAESSAGQLAALKQAIVENRVPVLFTELGTSPAVADAIGRESGAKVVELPTHALPQDDSYFSFMRNIARLIADGLK